MTVEAGAGPPSQFGHHNPVFCLALAAFGVECPGIDAVDELEGVFAPYSKLYAEVWSGGGIIKEVGLDGKVVAWLVCKGLRSEDAYTQQKEQCYGSTA